MDNSRGNRGTRSRIWFIGVTTLVLLGIWELLSRLGLISKLFFPAPSFLGQSLVRMVASGALPLDVGVTVLRLLMGFVLGTLPGLALGLVMGWSKRLRSYLDPFVAAFHPMPRTAMLPLFMVLLGIGESSKLAVIAIAAFFPVVINTMAGVRQISPIHFEVAANYNTQVWSVFSRIVLPGSLPLVMTGIRLAFNTAIHVTISVELLSAHNGLGALIWMAWETMRTEELYIGIAAAGVLGIGFNYLLKRASDRLIPWSAERRI